MTHGPGPGADEFARIRMARHRTYRRRFVLVAVVLVLVGAVTAGVLVTYGLSGDPEPERDADGRLVPPSGLALDDDAALELAGSGTSPDVDLFDEMPDDTAGRFAWLLTEVAWSDAQAADVASGIERAVAADADDALALTEGLADARRPLLATLAEPVARALVAWGDAVAAVLVGERPPAREPRFDDSDLLTTLAAVGLDSAAPLESRMIGRMRQGWRAGLPSARRDAPDAARRFAGSYPREFRRSAQPVVVMYAALAREECERSDDECRQVLSTRTARADATFAALVLDAIPRELLPAAVDRALGADRTPHRDLPATAQDAWERFRAQQGYGITGPVLDALAG